MKKWMEVLEVLGISHPERCMNVLQGLIWDIFTYPLLQEHNAIMHWSKNNIMQSRMSISQNGSFGMLIIAMSF